VSATLVLDDVTMTRRHGRGLLAPLLDRVSLRVARGEFVGVCGPRRSGRTTLLEVASGARPPEAGAVGVHEGDAITAPSEPAVALCTPLPAGRNVSEEVALPFLASGGTSFRVARQKARDLLRVVGAEGVGEMDSSDLGGEYAVRVELARALALEPRFLLIDEPTLGLPADERDALLVLLLRLTRERRIGVVVTAGDLPAMAGVDRALRLAGGTLRGRSAAEGSDVLELDRARVRGRSAM
jgi:ABC-type taurine transport system ATPase subunit